MGAMLRHGPGFRGCVCLDNAAHAACWLLVGISDGTLFWFYSGRLAVERHRHGLHLGVVPGHGKLGRPD